MFPNPAGQICGYADVERAMRPACHDVDVTSLRQLTLLKLRRASVGWSLSRF